MLRSGFKGRFCLARSGISLGISLENSLPWQFSGYFPFSFSLLGLCTLMQGPQANHVPKKDDPPKIRSHDYQAWDKYRAEEEAAKVDAEPKASTKVSKSKVSAQLSEKGTPSSPPSPSFCLLISPSIFSLPISFLFSLPPLSSIYSPSFLLSSFPPPSHLHLYCLPTFFDFPFLPFKLQNWACLQLKKKGRLWGKRRKEMRYVISWTVWPACDPHVTACDPHVTCMWLHVTHMWSSLTTIETLPPGFPCGWSPRGLGILHT